MNSINSQGAKKFSNGTFHRDGNEGILPAYKSLEVQFNTQRIRDSFEQEKTSIGDHTQNLKNLAGKNFVCDSRK